MLVLRCRPYSKMATAREGLHRNEVIKATPIDFEEENINIAACEYRNGSKLSCSTVYQENISRGWNEDIFPQVSER